jgi:hypothetical protein
MSVIVWKDNGCETTLKGNDSGGWISDEVVLWLGRRQNRYTVEWWREWSKLR